MDSLDGSSWDVVIAGTGLQPALLALALSRSDKKVLHLDRNNYYGGSEAALSVAEAETWSERVNDNGGVMPFRNASIQKTEHAASHLKSARAYSLSLSPCTLYTRSSLLTTLVSSNAHEQLEFLAVGSWFVYQSSPDTNASGSVGHLIRVPNNREDIFSSSALTLRVKSALVRFLRFVATYSSQEELENWMEWKNNPFSEFLVKRFKIQAEFHGPLLALSMSSKPNDEITTEVALASIHRHLTSMGVFGAGFSAVLPKYGGLSEVVQVACRAAAVGGAVYVLDRAIERVESASTSEGVSVRVFAHGNDTLTTKHLIGTIDQLPEQTQPAGATEFDIVCSRTISIVGSRLSHLFPRPAEGSPPPSAAVVVYPSGSITDHMQASANLYPVHLFIHTADTGECPSGQCVVYAMTSGDLQTSSSFLDVAVQRLLASAEEEPAPQVLWKMEYETLASSSGPGVHQNSQVDGLYIFTEPPPGPAFDDLVLDGVKRAWRSVTGEQDEHFMRFADRNADAET
ncbi:putative Rab proteins geranylgeranyltransferase component A [Elsinoe australis]|uniref:Rab proteins geranylgeranyltransferase n=1 Tax=Elsinoe australis TaxID=40998 RepID=A0A4V6DUE3_9PEZI|nr:putative Rab proteins geranylgeranyltransferase component A [Elsinoe australis]